MVVNSAQERRFRLKSSIAIVLKGDSVEFFDSNTRESLNIEIESRSALEIIQSFDGFKSVAEIANDFPGVDIDELLEISDFLNKERILIEVDDIYPEDIIRKRPRLVNLAESFFLKTSQVISGIRGLEGKTVLIIGLGAVGSWISHSLVKAGLQKLHVMDDDFVEVSNLHRQDLFFESDIGLYKVDAASTNLRKNYGVEVHGIRRKLVSVNDFDFLEKQPDIIINCADSPSVDATSRIVSDFCLPRKIPHIIGGGYNLHLTLVGQVIIPGYSACYHCFDSVLNKKNTSDLNGVRKLYREKRKIGSIGPACSLSSSVSSNEILKIALSVPRDKLSCAGKRLEFGLFSMDFSELPVGRDLNCEFCGKLGEH